MKTVVAGKFVVGKDGADVVVKQSHLMSKYGLTSHVDKYVQLAVEGKTIGVIPVDGILCGHQTITVSAHEAVDEFNRFVQEEVDEQNKPKGDVKKVAKKTKVQEQPKFASREDWVNAKSQSIMMKSTEGKPQDRAYRNASVGSFQKHAIEVANQRFLELGEYQVVVTGIEFFTKPDRNNRLGKLHVVLPRGYADVRWYNRKEGKAEWHDFGDYSLNQFRSSFNPPAGSGELTLSIRESQRDKQLYVMLPKSTGKEPGQYFDKLRCRDIRFGVAHSDNNKTLEAALTAYLRYFIGEFKQANPVNRHGVDEHCGTCKFNMYVPGYDGMDNEKEGYKNTLNTNDTIEMIQWGQEIPRRFCMVNRELTDLESAKAINEALQVEGNTYYDHVEGKVAFLKPGEIIMHGQAIHRYQAIKEGTAERCAACPFYHNNAAKSEKQISKEKAEGATYVSKYWSEAARPERMVVQSLMETSNGYEWVNEYPGATDTAIEFRVYGIGGLAVYGSEAVNHYAAESGVLGFVPMTEEVNEPELKASKVINIIHQSCNRFADVTPQTLTNIQKLIVQGKPDGISERMEQRWDKAVDRLVTTIQEYQEVQ